MVKNRSRGGIVLNQGKPVLNYYLDALDFVGNNRISGDEKTQKEPFANRNIDKN